MFVDELFQVRDNLLNNCKDEDGFHSDSKLLSEVGGYTFQEKMTDSDEIIECYFIDEKENIKLSGYTVNESGERLQLYIIDDRTIYEADREELLNSNRSIYDNHFKRALRFFQRSVTKKLNDSMQDSDPAKALSNKIASEDGIKVFDVVEIFLISLTCTVSWKGKSVETKSMYFPENKFNVKVRNGHETIHKEFLILFNLIDLNFIKETEDSRGCVRPLHIDFKKTFNRVIEVIPASKQEHFSSYLCVLDAEILAELYKHYSTRLLEKNVRSFLQFKGANKGIRDTLRKEPEKFIAYNNGLTITASDIKLSSEKKDKKRLVIESLTDLQIVNGGQTTASIYFSRKDGIDISKVMVMAKINVINQNKSDDLDDLVSKISQYSNTQSRVSSVDIRSRSSQLVAIKQLSESIATPNRKKWFFDRVKGDFNTKVKFAGSKAAKIKKDFPPAMRFSKEQLAKCYCSWGTTPFLVKKGGEKIFRQLMESLNGNDSNAPLVIDRRFYEELISKIILFRSLEKIYGQGPNAIGQIRSAVVPYAIASFYSQYTENKFNFDPIWQRQSLPEDLSVFFESLLKLLNNLIKKYSLSDDYGEYSKKEELWKAIIASGEIEIFYSQDDNKKIVHSFTRFESK